MRLSNRQNITLIKLKYNDLRPHAGFSEKKIRLMMEVTHGGEGKCRFSMISNRTST